MDNTNMQPNQEITKKKKWLLPVILGVAALLVIGLGVGGFIYIKSVALPKKELQKQLDLGDKYLTDMDYEKAVLSYKEAITIDPKNVKAYVGLGDAYLAWVDELVEEGDTEAAIKKLKKGIKELKPGIDETGSDEIKDKQNELIDKQKELQGDENVEKHTEPKPEDFKSVSVTSLPSGLENFFARLAWVGEYDNKSEECLSYFLYFILCCPYNGCDFSLYSDHCEVPTEDEIWDMNLDHYEYDANGIDWILSNIYNADNSILDKFKKDGYFENLNINYENGKYVAYFGGIGGGFTAKIKEAEKAGDYYHIVYTLENVYSPGVYEPWYAIMEYKTIDGKGYWSVYQTSKSALFELSAPAVTDTPKSQSYTDEELMSMALKWCAAYQGSAPKNAYVYPLEGNQVSIQLFDTVDNHINTWYWLTIDRTTGKGTEDTFGNSVDLTPYR